MIGVSSCYDLCHCSSCSISPQPEYLDDARGWSSDSSCEHIPAWLRQASAEWHCSLDSAPATVGSARQQPVVTTWSAQCAGALCGSGGPQTFEKAPPPAGSVQVRPVQVTRAFAGDIVLCLSGSARYWSTCALRVLPAAGYKLLAPPEFKIVTHQRRPCPRPASSLVILGAKGRCGASALKEKLLLGGYADTQFRV